MEKVIKFGRFVSNLFWEHFWIRSFHHLHRFSCFGWPTKPLTSISSVIHYILCELSTLLLHSSMELNHCNKIIEFSPILFSLPWDQSTLTGYIGEITFTLFNNVTFLIAAAALMLFFISLCFHHRAFSGICELMAAKLNRRDENCRNKEILCDLIRFHVSARE